MSTPKQSNSPVQAGFLTPELEDDQLDLATSPSFDYHEERRLHLKDEIWLSHHLPRLPPAALSESVSSLASSSDFPRGPRTGNVPADIQIGGQTADASPSAFHPKGLSIPRSDGHVQGMPQREADVHRGFQPISFPGSSVLTPNGPEDSDNYGPPTMIHREELDDQERLDLEEEERERQMGTKGALAGIAGLNLQAEREKLRTSAETGNAQTETGESGFSASNQLVFVWSVLQSTKILALLSLCLPRHSRISMLPVLHTGSRSHAFHTPFEPLHFTSPLLSSSPSSLFEAMHVRQSD